MNIFEKLTNELLAATHLKQVHDIVHRFLSNGAQTYIVYEYGSGQHTIRQALPSEANAEAYRPRGTGGPVRVGTFMMTGCEHMRWPIIMMASQEGETDFEPSEIRVASQRGARQINWHSVTTLDEVAPSTTYINPFASGRPLQDLSAAEVDNLMAATVDGLTSARPPMIRTASPTPPRRRPPPPTNESEHIF